MVGTSSQQSAINRIQRAHLMGAKELDLSELGLSMLPPEIGDLPAVEELSLSHNNLSDLPAEIGNLKRLKKLYLKDNKFSVLPPVIFQFEYLEKLSLIDNQLRDLPNELAAFWKLKWLAVGNSFYTQNLERARGGNNFPKIPNVVWEFRHLEELYITAVGLREISPKIEQLTNLKGLYLTTNLISRLPKEILSLNNLTTIQIRNNPLPIPAEIIERQDAKSILNYYFLNLESQQKLIRESKLLIIGQGSVGKTSLVKRVLEDSFDENQGKTEGIAVLHWYIEDSHQAQEVDVTSTVVRFYRPTIKVNIWDFGGQEIMHATHQFFLTRRSIYLLVIDSRLTQEENRVEYWLKIIQSFGGESPVLIIGNKIDQHPLDIDRTGLQRKYPNILSILETSAATGAGIPELKAAIEEQVNNLPHVRESVPKSWFIIESELERLGRESNYITYDKYSELCYENNIRDTLSQRTLIGFLHDLGVILCFQEDYRLSELGILNPQWVTDGVYKILNSHALFENKGVLTVSLLDEILNLPEYPRGKRLFIVDMMKKFELCYDIEPDKSFLVPDLLPKNQPDLIFNGIPAFEYVYPVLPPSVITRFIVRMNPHICDGFVWRTGVLLRIGENEALVKADIEDRKITIAIDGLQHTRRDALSAIRYQLDEIHSSIKGLDAEKYVPIPGTLNAKPLLYSYLLMLEAKGMEVLPVQDGNRLVDINVRQILSGIESAAQRKERSGNVTNIYVGGNVDGNMIVGDENVSNKS